MYIGETYTTRKAAPGERVTPDQMDSVRSGYYLLLLFLLKLLHFKNKTNKHSVLLMFRLANH